MCFVILLQRVPALPVNVVAMPPDNKKQCNGAHPPARVQSPAARIPAGPEIVNNSVPPPATVPAKRTPKDFIFGKTIGEGSFSTVSRRNELFWFFGMFSSDLIKEDMEELIDSSYHAF